LDIMYNVNMQVSPEQILPSQDFLKERTCRFIFECLNTGNLEELPPTPLVRKDPEGRLVAIDGHNLIAVRYNRNEPIEVIVATSSTDGLPATSEANVTRNQELAAKYDTVLDEQRRVAAEGITSFAALIEKYPDLFTQSAA
jgi:hypothetical protein